MTAHSYPALSEVGKVCLADPRDAFEQAYSVHLEKIHPQFKMLISECRFGDGYGDEFSFLQGAWTGWQLRSIQLEPLKLEHLENRSYHRQLIISALAGAVVTCLGLIGNMPNDLDARADRQFSLCLKASSPADATAIQACKDASKALHSPKS